MKIYLAVPIIAFRNLELASALAGRIEAMGHRVSSPWVLRVERRPPKRIFVRDLNGVRRSDALVAEVSSPSTGVGMEVMAAIDMGKPVLALYRRGARVSKMLLGAPITKKSYAEVPEAGGILERWVKTVENNMRYMVVIDLDETLWSHPDISSTSPPYRRAGREVIVDSKGVAIRLNRGWLELLSRLRAVGVRLGVVSWNKPYEVCEALTTLGLRNMFDYVVAENHPEKDVMMGKLFQLSGIAPANTVFIDNNLEMIEKTVSRYPSLKTILYSGSDARRLAEGILEMLPVKLDLNERGGVQEGH